MFFILDYPRCFREKSVSLHVSYKLICTANGLSIFTVFSVYVLFSLYLFFSKTNKFFESTGRYENAIRLRCLHCLYRFLEYMQVVLYTFDSVNAFLLFIRNVFIDNPSITLHTEACDSSCSSIYIHNWRDIYGKLEKCKFRIVKQSELNG